jgi:ribosome-associated protein
MITDKIFEEVVFKAVRSGGKGGQNVNKVSTKVELYFNVYDSLYISYEDKITLLNKLSNRIDKNGVLRLTSETERSQFRNKQAVTEKFKGLLKEALKKTKKRLKTKPTAGSKEKRISSKKVDSKKKTMRKKDININDE